MIFSNEEKFKILSLVKKKPNIKLVIVERNGINEEEAIKIVKDLGWDLSNLKRLNVFL